MNAPPNELTTAVVLRPKRGLVVSLAFLDVVFVLMLIGTAANGDLRAVLPALAVLLFSWLLFVVVRRRTEVGPEGLVNQTWNGREHLPWSELSRVMTTPQGLLVVTRRAGGQVGFPGPPGRGGPSTAQLVRLIEGEIDRHRPVAAPSSPGRPEVIERRGEAQSARKVLVWGVFIAIGVGAAVATGRPSAGVVAGVIILGLFGLLALAIVRARTVLGPDGIHNRTLREDRFIPWSDITSITGMETVPRVIRVSGPGGRTTTLAAVTERAAAADGLTFDDLVAVIRERAGVLEDRIETSAAAPAEPLSLRPSRRPILWLVPFGLAALPVVYLAWGGVATAFFFGYLLLIPVFTFMLVLKLLLGRTEADADGVRNRMIIRRAGLRWDEVTQIIISPTPFGRRVQLKRANRQVALAAPREGLLAKDPAFDDKVERLRALAAAATGSVPPVSTPLSRRATLIIVAIPTAFILVMSLWIGRPWLNPWWPGRHEATALPKDCADLQVAELIPQGRPDKTSPVASKTFSNCAWETENGSELSVGYEMDEKSFDQGATEQTRHSFALFKATDPAHWRSVPGLGDEAIVKTESRPEHVMITYKVRRANVVTTVIYEAEPGPQVAADLEALVRQSVSRIHID